MICPQCHVPLDFENAAFCLRCSHELRGRSSVTLRPADWSRRTAALAIDYALLSLIISPLALYLFPPLPYEREALERGPAFIAENPQIAVNMFLRLTGTMTLTVLIVFLYNTLLEGSSQQGSFGKKWLGLKVADLQGQPLSLGRAAWRQICRVASVVPMYAGFFWPFFDPQKRTFHDILSGTMVADAREPRVAAALRPQPPPLPSRY